MSVRTSLLSIATLGASCLALLRVPKTGMNPDDALEASGSRQRPLQGSAVSLVTLTPG